MSLERINQDKENEAKTAALLALIPDNLVTSGSSFSGVSDSITGTAYGITARAGGGQLAATQLASEYNVITTCATAKDSVKLPEASAGQVVIVHNSGAASCDVFPYTSDSINTLAINLAIAIPVGAEIKFTGMSDNWWVSDSVALTLTAPTTQRGSLVLRAANSVGETETVITNSSQAAARTYSIPDAGANADFMMSAGTTSAKTITTLTSTTANITTANISNVRLTTPLVTAGSAAVAVAEYGDGRDFTTVLTLTNFIVGAIPAANAALAVGNIVCTFPAGAHVESVYYKSISLTLPGAAEAAAVSALGSVIGSTAVAVLNGTATFMDRSTEQTTPTAAAGGAVTTSLVKVTAGAYTGIGLNVAASVKDVFLNAAGTWVVANAGNLTATGTISFKWTKMSA